MTSTNYVLFYEFGVAKNIDFTGIIGNLGC